MYSEETFFKSRYINKKISNDGKGGGVESLVHMQATVEKWTYMATRVTVPRHAWTPTS